MSEVRTVMIKGAEGVATRINESDFDKEIHEMYDSETASDDTDEITRETISKMVKPDVKELLEAHGADTSGNVSKMRDRLIAVMFID